MEDKRVIALGFFDGAHLGHRELFRAVRKRAEELSAEPAVISFDAEPLGVITGARVPLINTPMERAELIKSIDGIKNVIFLHFDREMMQMEWSDFIEWLVYGFGAVHLVVGYDFRCGRGGGGNASLIAEKCRALNVGLDVIPERLLDGIRISSTYIRELLESGSVERANRFLGHPHIMAETVIFGYRFGRTLGVPTINMAPESDLVRLPNGVYATKSRTPDGKTYRSITYIGTRPTVSGGNTAVSVETHLDGFSGDLYGQRVRIEFYLRLREERRFDTHEELKKQILDDMDAMRSYFDSTDK